MVKVVGMIAIVKLGLDLNIEIMTVAMILRNVSMIIGVLQKNGKCT